MLCFTLEAGKLFCEPHPQVLRFYLVQRIYFHTNPNLCSMEILPKTLLKPNQHPTLLMVADLNQLLWSLIGLLLTIGGTFVEAYFTSSPWNWNQYGIQSLSLGVTYQIGAVLLVGCLGGRNAGAISQIAYLVIGLTLFPIFAQGGGIDYLKQPQFGYLLGFIPGAWVCGFLAFQGSPKLESLAFSCTCGLLTIHLTGLIYLILTHALSWANTQALSLVQAVFNYSFYPLPGQLAVVCAVTVLAYCLRHLMFY